EEAPESRDPATLPDENARQSHLRRFLPYPFETLPHPNPGGFPRYGTTRGKANTAASGKFPAYPPRPILVLRVDLTRVAPDPQENPASRAIRIRPGLPRSGRPALPPNWIVGQKR